MCAVNVYQAASPHRACGSHQPCKASRGIQAFATLCCPPPAISPPSSRDHCYFPLSFMSLCHLPSSSFTSEGTEPFQPPWAAPRLNHLLPQTTQAHLPNIIISIHSIAVTPSIPRPVFSHCPFCFPDGPPAPNPTPVPLPYLHCSPIQNCSRESWTLTC